MATANKGTKPKVGGVRFAPNQTVEGPSSHVHFDEKLHDSVVMVTQEKDGNFLVKVGFLKILHKYEITFLLPFVPRLGKDISAAPLPNLNLRVIDITPASEESSPSFYVIPLRMSVTAAGKTSGPTCQDYGWTTRKIYSN